MSLDPLLVTLDELAEALLTPVDEGEVVAPEPNVMARLARLNGIIARQISLMDEDDAEQLLEATRNVIRVEESKRQIQAYEENERKRKA
jgi:hypothetical protein